MSVFPKVEIRQNNFNPSMNAPIINFEKLVFEEVKIKNLQNNRLNSMYEYPATKHQADKHINATMFGYNPKGKGKKQITYCPCCQLPANTSSIQLCYQTTPSRDIVKVGNQMFKLNSGTSLFFTFIKMNICYLVMRFIITDIYNIISSMNANFCRNNSDPKNCVQSVFTRLSGFNKMTELDQPLVNILDLLNFITVIVTIIFFILYRRYQYKIFKILEGNNHTQDDYSVFIENIPIFIPIEGATKDNIQFDYQNILKNAINEKLRLWVDDLQSKKINDLPPLEKNFKHKINNKTANLATQVRSVTLCFDLTQLQNINNLRSQLMEEHILNQENGKDTDIKNQVDNIPTQIEIINREYLNLIQKFAKDNSIAFNFSHFIGRAFVSLEYQHYRDYLVRQARKNKDFLKINNKPLTIELAMDPSDIYWFNLKISKQDRLKTVLFSAFTLIVSLVIAFAVLLLIQYFQNHQTESQSSDQLDVLSYIVTLLMTVLTSVINFLLSMLITKLTEKQRHISKTHEINSLVIKNVIAQFLNTAVIYFILSLVAPEIGPLGQNGLVVSVSSLVGMSGLIQIGMNFVQIGSVITCLTNWWKGRKGDEINQFQVLYNQSVQNPEFDFATRYSYYIVQVYVVCFYSYIAPANSIMLAGLFLAQYWVDKFNLFKRFSCPTQLNFDLSRTILKTFQVSVLIFAVGNLIFSNKVHVTEIDPVFRLLPILGVIISAVYIIFAVLSPPQVERLVFKLYESWEQASYQQILERGYFTRSYWTRNPGTAFCRQPDLNKEKSFVNYHPQCNTEQYSIKFKQNQNNDEYIETYDENDIRQIDGGFSDDDDNDVSIRQDK